MFHLNKTQERVIVRIKENMDRIDEFYSKHGTGLQCMIWERELEGLNAADVTLLVDQVLKRPDIKVWGDKNVVYMSKKLLF